MIVHSEGGTQVAAKRRNAKKKKKEAAATRPIEPKDVAPDAPLILLVDDIEDNRDLYATYFTYAGYRVEQARDGDEALAKVAREKPHLIVMDLAMPILDGWEATRIVKSNPRTQDIIVIVLTGHTTPEDLARARAAGADEVCTKPCYPHDLLGKIRVLLGRDRDRPV